MALEIGTYINDLVTSNPPGGDNILQGDDHLRLIKTVLKNTFPNASKAFTFPSALAKSANYTFLLTDVNKYVVADATAGAFNLTLPVLGASDDGWAVVVEKKDSSLNAVTLVGTINGVANLALTAQYSWAVVWWSGTAWFASYFNPDSLTLTSLDAGATAGPTLTLDRNSASPAASDILGQILFNGRNDAAATKNYGVVDVIAEGVGSGAENGSVRVRTMQGGSLTTKLRISAGIWTSNALTSDKGNDTVNAVGYYQNGNIIFPRGHIDGLTLSTDAGNNVTVAAGQAVDDGGTYVMTLGSAITKSMAGTWAVGTSQNGLDAGSEAANTWYHIWLIERPDTGVVDVLISTSASAPTMPTNYTKKRRIGAVRNNASSNILQFSQFGDEFLLDAAIVDIDATNPGTAAVSRTLTVPTGVKVIALFSGGWYNVTNNSSIVFSALDVSDQAPQTPTTAALSGFSSMSVTPIGASAWGIAPHQVRTNTSAQIRSRASASGANDRLGIITRGWIDPRGRNA